MVSRELLGLANLSGAQTFYIHKTTEVIIVGKDKNFMLATFQIVTLRLKDLNNSQKLTVIDLIPSLYKNHFHRREGY